MKTFIYNVYTCMSGRKISFLLKEKCRSPGTAWDCQTDKKQANKQTFMGFHKVL